MVSKKITQQKLDEMIEAKKKGATYVEIEARFNVSRWVTIHYLKNIQQEITVAEELWKQAEKKQNIFYLKKVIWI